MSDLDNLKFPSSEDLPEQERRVPPEGTPALVQVRPDRDGNLGEFKSGDSGYGPWIAIPFEVIEGEWAGTWAGLMLSVDPTDRRFRAVFSAVMGVDISSGGEFTFSDFKKRIVSGVFQAEIGPEKKRGEPTGYTRVSKLLERVRDREVTVSSASEEEAPVVTPDGDDEDIPF